MKKIQVRHCEPGDAAALRAIFEQPSCYAGTLQLPHPPLEQWKNRLEKRPAGYYSLVAEVEGEVVGQIGLQVLQNPRRRHVAQLGMAVHEGFRGLGVGSRLLAEIIELAEAWLGVERIELEVFTDNEGARVLYEKHGFSPEGVATAYALRAGKYVDALRMARLRPHSR